MRMPTLVTFSDLHALGDGVDGGEPGGPSCHTRGAGAGHSHAAWTREAPGESLKNEDSRSRVDFIESHLVKDPTLGRRTLLGLNSFFCNSSRTEGATYVKPWNTRLTLSESEAPHGESTGVWRVKLESN